MTNPLPQTQTAEPASKAVQVGPTRVTLLRKVAGISVQVGVALATYRGVALSKLRENGQDLWQVRLVHRDADLSVVLAHAHDDSNIIAEWRAQAARFSLPALLELAPGRFEVASATCARPIARRRGSAVRGRRARFLACRRMADVNRERTSYAGAREIIAHT